MYVLCMYVCMYYVRLYVCMYYVRINVLCMYVRTMCLCAYVCTYVCMYVGRYVVLENGRVKLSHYRAGQTCNGSRGSRLSKFIHTRQSEMARSSAAPPGHLYLLSR